MRDASVKSYSPAFPLGKTIDNDGVAKVFKSNNANFNEGELITGRIGLENYSVISENQLVQFKKIANPNNLPLSNFTSALGMPGLTA